MSGASQVMSHHHFDQPTRYGHPKGVDKRIIDAMPHVPAAGGPQKVYPGSIGSASSHQNVQGQSNASRDIPATLPAGESVASCCANYPDDDFSKIPEDQWKWRSTYRRIPGLQMSAPGLYGGSLPPAEFRHGMTTRMGERVGDCLQSDYSTPAQDLIMEQKERNYRSRRFEPLGTHFTRGVALPADMENPDFRFGMKTKGSEGAGSVIHGKGMAPPPPSTHKQYITAIGGATVRNDALETPVEAERDPTYVSESEVTRPVDRNYNWGTIDPRSFRFGRPAQNADLSSSEGVRACLEPPGELTDGSTRIASNRVQNFKLAQGGDVGARKLHSGNVATLPSDYVFGMPSKSMRHIYALRGSSGDASTDEWGAKQCIENVEGDAEEDAYLGQSLPRFRHIAERDAPLVDRERRFGLPSLRYDKKEPRVRSVADDNNYGYEHSAGRLLRPQPFGVPGVSQDSFDVERDPKEVRDLLRRAGREFTDEEWRQLVGNAEKVSVNGVREVTRMRESTRQAFNKQTGQPQTNAMTSSPLSSSGTSSSSLSSSSSSRPSSSMERSGSRQETPLRVAAIASLYSR